MIVVVGGQSRNCGKTTAICEIIAATPEAEWTAIKITPDAHGADISAPIFSEDHESGTDTGRYMAAGAVRAIWLRCRPEHLAEAVKTIESKNLIVESNAAVGILSPDLFVFLKSADSEEWKASARKTFARADFVLCGQVDASVVDTIRSKLD